MPTIRRCIPRVSLELDLIKSQLSSRFWRIFKLLAARNLGLPITDPLTIVAILAGIFKVVKTGTSLSKDLHRFFASIQNAPSEILDIAARISDLSFILGELRDFLEVNKDLCKRRLLKIINSTIDRISAIHKQLKGLMDGHATLQRLLWVYNKPEIQYKLSVIESHKSGIQLIQNTLLLGALTRKEKK